MITIGTCQQCGAVGKNLYPKICYDCLRGSNQDKPATGHKLPAAAIADLRRRRNYLLN